MVPSTRFLIPIGDLDPREAAPLSDAALTSYHAVKRSLHLLGAGSTAVVIGAGGLGQMAIQLLRALSAATTIIALDTAPDKLATARQMGADEALVIRQLDKVEAIRSRVNKTRQLLILHHRQVLTPEQRVKFAQAERERAGRPAGGQKP